MGKYKDLDGLLWQAMKVSRPTTTVHVATKPEVRLGFDADRFRWYFKNREGRSIQEWRDIIDKEILRENAEHPTASETNNEPS